MEICNISLSTKISLSYSKLGDMEPETPGSSSPDEPHTRLSRRHMPEPSSRDELMGNRELLMQCDALSKISELLVQIMRPVFYFVCAISEE